MSTEAYSSSSFETESEMLPQDPPPKVIRFMGWWLICLFIIGLLAAIFVHLPETEHAAFVLVPRDGADPIQSPRLATVNRVSVAEGQTVPAGAELFVLQFPFSRTQQTLKTRGSTPQRREVFRFAIG